MGAVRRQPRAAAPGGLGRGPGPGRRGQRAARADRRCGAARRRRAAAAPTRSERDRGTTAFLCAEYAIHCSLPVYSGGLGALAGDLVKQASDDDAPLVAVGLMYREGYFRQRLDASGWQHEYWTATDPPRLPAALVTRGRRRVRSRSRLPIGGVEVAAQAWRVAGRSGAASSCWTATARRTRRRRGGSLRASTSRTPTCAWPSTPCSASAACGCSAALGIAPCDRSPQRGARGVRRRSSSPGPSAAGGRSLDEALELARERTVFTTHTPVPAGNDTYPAEQVLRRLSGRARRARAGSRDAFARAGSLAPRSRTTSRSA